MPVIKSAKKKLRQDKKRTLQNKSIENLFKKMVKEAQKNPSEENIKKAVSVVDKMAQKNTIHKNKASRIKSTLSKLSAKKPKLPKTKVSANP
ncbi:MAG: 30S ribosomal protein S20 [Patescibacteria group bacterium]